MFDNQLRPAADRGDGTSPPATSAASPPAKPGDPPASDAAVLADLIDVLAGIAPATAQDEAIDRVRVLEDLKAACAAAQARETAALRRMRCAE